MPDDSCLVDPQLGAVARIYKLTSSPQGAQWFWPVQIDAQGRPWNSDKGNAAAGAEAMAKATLNRTRRSAAHW